MSRNDWIFTLPEFKIDQIEQEQECVRVVARRTTRTETCPDCQQSSTRVHSYYIRTIKDSPLQEHAVRLRLKVRRFRCMNQTCSRQTFAEALPSLAAKHAQRSTRFTFAVRAIGLALGGEAGQRLGERLHLPVSADTLLRIIRRSPVPADDQALRVIGIDDWAWKRSRAYGALVVDLEHHRPVELLADRTAETLASWLKRHPSIRTVTRDRSTEFQRGIQLGAPQARQVADRWHMLKNLHEVLERLVSRLHAELRQLPLSRVDPSEPPRPRRERRSAQEQAAKLGRRQRRLERFAQVRRLHQDGLGILPIAQKLKLSRVTVRKYVKAETFPEQASRPRRGHLTPFEPYLRRRWQQGCRNAMQLWREVRAQGFRGTNRQVSKWVNLRREEPRRSSSMEKRGKLPMAHPSVTSSASELPSSKKLAWLLVKATETLEDTEARDLQRIQQHPSVARSYKLAQRFRTMIRQHTPERLDPWLAACEQSQIPDLISFATGLRSDYAAVKNALKLEWSNGQLEGQINRLKFLKRQMYGRAKFDLLRSRVLSTA